MRRCLALTFLLAGCDPSSVELGVILPRDGEALLANVSCYRLEARRGAEVVRDTASDPYSLHLDGLSAGAWDMELEAVEQPSPEGCEDGEVRARAQTFSAQLSVAHDTEVPLLLLPVDRPVTLDVPSWVEAWFDGRTELAAAVARDVAGVPRVVFAGGRTPQGVPSAEAVVYEPRAARFSVLPDLACARVGAAALAIAGDGESERILLAGGDGDCADGNTAPATSELLDPVTGETETATLAVSVARPVAIRDGPVAWLLGSTTSEAIVQRFDETGWGQSPARDTRFPVTGGTFAPVFPDGAAPYLVAGGRDGSGELLQGISLFEPGTDSLSACAIDVPSVPISGDDVVAVPTRNGDVFFTANAPDGGATWFRQSFRSEPSCGAIAGIARGQLATARRSPAATPIGRGRIVLSAGDAEGTIEVFLPLVGGTLSLAGETERRDGHVAVGLEDGSVLIAGGGPPTVQAVLPRRGLASRLHWDSDAELAPKLDVLVVASSHSDAHAILELLGGGGFLDAERGLQSGVGPQGFAAAIPALHGPEFENADNLRVVVTSGDMRCDGTSEGRGGRPRPCSKETPNLEEEVVCELAELEEANACGAQELLRAALTAAASELGGPGADGPLVVLIAAPRDDCSLSDDAIFELGGPPLTERCDDAADLLDPAEVADLLYELRDPALVSVMTFGGPDAPIDGAPAEACPGILPTPRLAAFSRAMGVRGKHIDLCATSSGHPPLQWWSELVEGRIGRRVCLPYAPTSPASCVVTYERQIDDGVREAVRIAEGDDGWRVTGPAPDANCPNGSLQVSPRLELPIGARVGYACQ